MDDSIRYRTWFNNTRNIETCTKNVFIRRYDPHHRHLLQNISKLLPLPQNGQNRIRKKNTPPLSLHYLITRELSPAAPRHRKSLETRSAISMKPHARIPPIPNRHHRRVLKAHTYTRIAPSFPPSALFSRTQISQHRILHTHTHTHTYTHSRQPGQGVPRRTQSMITLYLRPRCTSVSHLRSRARELAREFHWCERPANYTFQPPRICINRALIIESCRLLRSADTPLEISCRGAMRIVCVCVRMRGRSFIGLLITTVTSR